MAISRFYRGLYSAVVILLLFSPYMSLCLLSDYKICGDAECESLMCRVQATKDHHGKDCRFLSFKRGDTIFVYHKLTGRRQDLWAGSIDKQFGYFPKDAVKEEQVYATAEKVVQTQKFDFFCLDENGYPTDSSHLETDEDDGNADDDHQGNPHSETNHGSLDAKLKDKGIYSTSQDPIQLNHQGALSENNGQTEDSSGTLENMEPGDGSGDGHGPNKQGGSPSSSSSSSSWFGSTVTGLLGMQQGSEHAEIENTPEEDEEAKAEEAENSLASSVTQWLGYGEQGEIDETMLGQVKERTEMGEAGPAFTSTVNSWLGYGNERTEDAKKSVKAEMEIVEEEEKKETFRSRKLALDLESHQLQEEELAVPGTLDWLGDTMSSTIGLGLTRQDLGLEKKTDKEEVENTNKDVKPSPSHSWYDFGIGDALGFGKNAGKVDSTVESGLKTKGDDMEKHTELQNNESEVANLDEVKALQIKLEKDPQTAPSSDSFLSKLDNVLSLDQEDDYDDNEKGGETKEADEKVSAQTKQGNYTDLTQYSLESENDEGSVEVVFDGKADEESKTETGTLNPGVTQTNTAGDQIFASTQFHDTMQQNQGDNRYARDGKETVRATDDGLHNTFEAEELNSSHREALSDSVAGKTEETEINEILTHVNSAATRVEEAVVLVLPDDIRPGPDLYGVPWEPVIITSLVGLVTILMFSCRFYNSVKSRMYRGKERRVAKHISDLLNDKCKVLEAVSKVQTEYDELESVLRDSGVLAQTEKAEQLELQFSQLECSNKDLERDLEVLKEQLKIHGEHRVQQERTIAELEESIKASEKETKELQAQEEEAVTTLKVYNMNSERLQRNLESAGEENILLQDSNTQLSEQMEGWVERVSELEDEMRRCEAAHTVMQQDVDTKDHRIKYLTDRLLGMKALDSDLEQEDEGERDSSNGDENERHLQKVQKLIYAAKLNADLKSMDEDKDRTFAKLNDEIQAKEELQQGIKGLEEERSSLQTQAEHYTEQVQRLQQKLLIMTEMYQENELKLHRLLTVEEKERLQKEEKLNKADKNISLAMEELDNYRQQAENMEEELEKTKQSYQTQISSHEKKAHNNWLAARSAERDLADIRRENALLRQKLTDTQFKLDAIDKDPYALDSLARPLPFRGERSPYGPSPLGRPASETRPFLSPPTLMEGPCSRLSPRVPRVPLEPPAGGREIMERSGGPHSDGSNSPTWERDRRGPPPPPGPLGPPGYMFPEPGPPMYRRPLPMGLPLPHHLHPGPLGPMPLGPPRGHPAAMGPPGPPIPMDMASESPPRPADLRPEVDGRMGGDSAPPGPPFPRRGPHGPLPLDFYPPPSRGLDGGPRMPMWRPPPHPGVMLPPPRMLPPGGPPPLLLPHQPSPYTPGVRPPIPPPPGAHLPPPSSSTDPCISPPEQTPPLPAPSEQAPSPHHLI
ncbi:unnamed protein product [Lota lota]